MSSELVAVRMPEGLVEKLDRATATLQRDPLANALNGHQDMTRSATIRILLGLGLAHLERHGLAPCQATGSPTE